MSKPKESSIPGNALEAFIGALYLDKGFDFSKHFVETVIVGKHLDMEDLIKKDENFKSALLEWSQKEYKKITWGHKQNPLKIFQNSRPYFMLMEKKWCSANGKSKKIAEQLAAEIALNKINL